MNPAEQSFLQSIAPNDLTIRRTNRYDGTGTGMSLQAFHPDDQKRIRIVYETVNRVYQTWLHEKKDLSSSVLQVRLKQVADSKFLRTIQKIGRNGYFDLDDGQRNLIDRALHDIKGGSLNGLFGTTQLLEEMGWRDDRIQKAVYMARDHAKIMRNILVDIDPRVREDDESAHAHHINHFTEKLNDFAFEFEDLKLSVHLHCSYQGDISNCCLETSSIDRILFNFINNSAKYSASHEVNVYIFAVNDQMIRWVFQNPVSEEHVRWFQQHCDETMWDLFLSKRTYKGQGFGLYNCAEIVGNSFGVSRVEDTVRQGYIGAKLDNEVFYNWFHWPTMTNHDLA